jgi:hypothetical protein
MNQTEEKVMLGAGAARPRLVYASALHGDVEMSPHPTGMTLGLVAHTIGAGKNIQVMLESGDVTRYDVVICPLFQPTLRQLLVARLTPSGSFRAACTIPDPTYSGEFAFNEAADRVAINDGWERRFFRWWLTCLWLELRRVR